MGEQPFALSSIKSKANQNAPFLIFDMAMKYADVISLNEATEYVRGLPDNLFAPAL